MSYTRGRLVSGFVIDIRNEIPNSVTHRYILILNIGFNSITAWPANYNLVTKVSVILRDKKAFLTQLKSLHFTLVGNNKIVTIPSNCGATPVEQLISQNKSSSYELIQCGENVYRCPINIAVLLRELAPLTKLFTDEHRKNCIIVCHHLKNILITDIMVEIIRIMLETIRIDFTKYEHVHTY